MHCTRKGNEGNAPNVLRDLSREGREESAERTSSGSNVGPVEADGEHSESLVTVRSSEDASEPGRVATGETEDRDTGERRGDELGDPLPAEDGDEDDPEESETFLLHALVLVAVECVEEVDRRHQVGVDDVGREDGEGTSETGETVSEELRSEEGEDSNSVVRRNVVVDCQCSCS